MPPSYPWPASPPSSRSSPPAPSHGLSRTSADGLEKGSIVTVPFGRAHRRGVVVATNDDAPDDVEPVAVEEVLGASAGAARRPRALARGRIRIDPGPGARPRRARRSESAEPGARRRRAGRRPRGRAGRPSELTDAQRSVLDRVVSALGKPGPLPPLRRDRKRQDRGVPPRLRGRARARARRDRARARDRADAAGRRPLSRALRRPRRRPPLGAHRRRAARRARADPGRRGPGGRRRPLGRSSRRSRPLGLICVDEEQDASYKQESDPRYDARTVAAKRGALESAVVVYGTATPRPESWQRLERLELGKRLSGSLPPVKVVDLRREAGYPLSAPLLEELGKVVD